MPGLLRGVARTAAIAGTATAVSNRVSRRQGTMAAQEQQQYDQHQHAPPRGRPPAPAPTGRRPPHGAEGARRAQGAGRADRSRVRGREGQDPSPP